MDLYSIMTAVFWMALMLTCFITGVFYTLKESILLTKRLKIRSNGVKARATIISTWEKRAHKFPNKWGVYLAEISFENESGVTIRGCYTSNGNYLSKFQYGAGEEVDIIYCKNNHNEFYLPSDKQELHYSVYLLILGLVWLSIPVVLVMFMFL